MNFYFLLPLFGFIANVFLGFVVIFHDNRKSENRYFFMFTIALAYWSIMNFLTFCAPNSETALFWARMAPLGACFTALFLLHYFIIYTHVDITKLIKYILFSLYSISIIISLFSVFTSMIIKNVSVSFWGYQRQVGIVYYLETLFILGCIIVGLYLNLKYYYKLNTKSGKKQSRLLSLAMLVPLMGGILSEPIPKILGIEVIPLSTTLSTIMAAIIGYAIYKYKLLTPFSDGLHEKLNFLVSKSPTVLYNIEINGSYKMQFMSSNIKTILGYEFSKITKTNCIDFWTNLIHPDDRSNVIAAGLKLKSTGSLILEYRIKDINEDYHWIHDVQQIITHEEGKEEIVGSWYDITERKMIEKELCDYRDHLKKIVKERTSELEKELSKRKLAEKKLVTTKNDLEKFALKMQYLNDELKDSNEELQHFAYIASHDLLEPLRMISNYTKLLEKRYKDKLDDDANEFIHYAVDGAIRMKKLINGLLSFSRISTNAQPLVETDINEIISDILNDLQFQINETKTIINYTNLPSVSVDKIQITRVFQNLISNAIKFSNTTQPEINIDVKNDDKYWIFLIKDNGIGIDVDDEEKVFQMFYRLHTREEYPGTGIGLAICKKIIKRHNGKIWFDTEKGKGTTFQFTIPMNSN